MVGVVVVGVVGDDHVRPGPAQQLDEDKTLGLSVEDELVGEIAEEDGSPDERCSLIRLCPPDAPQCLRRDLRVAGGAVGDAGDRDVVALTGVPGERASAEDLDVVRMSSHGQHVHG